MRERKEEKSLFCLEITRTLRDTAENSRLPCRPSKAVQFRAGKDSRKGAAVAESLPAFKKSS